MKYLVNPVTAFCVILLWLYLLSSGVVWLYYKITISGNIGLYLSMSRYARIHGAELKKNIFGTAFVAARRCSALPDEGEKTLCISSVKVLMGNSVKEEELSGGDRYMWPNDLFFVKRERGDYFRLGWDGEIRNIIADESELKRQTIRRLFFDERCNYFHSKQADMGACEIFAEMPLPDGDMGYMVRIDGQTEEDYFLFILMSPVFIILSPAMFWTRWTFGFALIAFLQMAVPATVSALCVRRLIGSGFFHYVPRGGR